jgi:hypothetical protein
MTRPTLLLAGIAALAGCTNGGDGDKNPGTDDTGGEQENYEPGCILVDGEGGYALLEDAQTVASEGSTISLAECASPFNQGLIVTKNDLTILGPGADVMTWEAPVNEPALTIQAGGVTVSGFTITSTRNGIELEAADATLSELAFVDIPNTAIKSANSALTVTDSSFTAPQYGGISVSGGTATISGNTFTDPLGFAVRSSEGAVATVTGNAVSGTLYTDATNVVDGFALFGDGGSLITEDNQLVDNFVGVYVEQGDLTMTGDAIEGGLYGVFAQLGAIDVREVSTLDCYTLGMYLVAQTDDVVVQDVTVTGTPELVWDTTDVDATTWTGGGMVVATDATATMTNVTIDGYNNTSLQVLPYSAEITAVLDTVTLINTGRNGLYFSGADATLTDVSVLGLRQVHPEDEINVGGSYSMGFAVRADASDVVWTGGAITDSEEVGMVSVQSNVTLDDVESSGHSDIGLWNYQGNLTLTNSFLSDSPSGGGIQNSTGALIVEGCTFEDNLADEYVEYSYESWTYMGTGTNGNSSAGSATFSDPDALFVTEGFEAGDVIYLYDEGAYTYIDSVDSETELTMTSSFSNTVTGGSYAKYQVIPVVYGYLYETQSQDIFSSDHSLLEVRDSTFTNGSLGLYVYGGSDTVIENNTWENYWGYALRFYTMTDSAEVKDITLTNTGPFGIYCNAADVQVSGLELNGSDAASREVIYYRDGVEDGGYTSTTSGEAIYAYKCNLTLEDASLSNTALNALYASDSSLELSDVTVDGSGTSESLTELWGTIYAEWSSTEPYLLASDVELSNISQGDGFGVRGAPYYGVGYVEIDGLSVDGAAGDGLVISDVEALITSSELTGNGDAGLAIYGGYALIDSVQSTGNLGWGLATDDADDDGYALADGDCNDLDATVYPGASETYDYQDNDCDGVSDYGSNTGDYDGDGFSITDGDCDDYDAARYPGSTETGNSGLDIDCDGVPESRSTELDVSLSDLDRNGLGGAQILGASVAFEDSSASDNTGFGLVCGAEGVVTDCDVELSGNSDGEEDGCGCLD